MVKNQIDTTQACPVGRSVDLIGDRWSLLILRDAFDGTRRFGDFQEGLGVARSVLANRLKNLVEAGVLEVQPASDGTSYQEYVLSPQGKGLFPIVVAFRQWGERYLFEPNEARSQLLETSTGRQLNLMQPVNTDGRVVEPEDTWVKKVL